MEINSYVLAVIIGCAIVTFIPRVLPLMLLSRLELPTWAVQWLKHIPVAVMAALLAQELLISDGHFSLSENKLELFACIPAFLTAILTRSLLGTVIVGLLSMMLLRFFC